MRAQPVAASGAILIDALHGPARQILHVLPPVAAHARQIRGGRSNKMPGIVARVECGVKTKPHKVWGQGCVELWISCA
jgi:hypothetical protein